MIAEADCMKIGRINYIDFVKFWRNFILSQNISPLQKFIRVSVYICLVAYTLQYLIQVNVNYSSDEILFCQWFKAARKVSNGVAAVKIMRKMCTASIANAAASALILPVPGPDIAVSSIPPLISTCISPCSSYNILPSCSTSSKNAPFLIAPASPRSGSSLFNYSASPTPQLKPSLLDTNPRRQRSCSVTSIIIKGQPAVRRNSATSNTSAKLSVLIMNKQYERIEIDSVRCRYSGHSNLHFR